VSSFRGVGFAVAALLALTIGLAGLAGAGSVALFGGGDAVPSLGARASIPAPMLTLYEEAATTCPGLPWTVLAAIGTIESDNGSSMLPGVQSGANVAGAEGPMQFEPATFAEYDQPIPPGGADPASPYDATDAVFAAARMLCADGGSGGVDLPAAIFAYNHSQTYVDQVLALARSYSQALAPTAGSADGGGTVGGAAVAWALAQVGTPYVWGGETPGVGFDCSGLVQAAYLVAGVSLPRVAQDQFDAGPQLPSGTPLLPGDLVFFGQGPTTVTHVGLVVSPGRMVDAPHTGADVREESFPPTVGTSWGDEVVVGFTRPAAGS
jgi:cell wall-associated NlpC family hydrolase